jgi:glycosyltransferase involved in cell wall biosynthesis
MMNKLMSSSRKGILFCMRYPDDQGFVWKTIAQTRDATASALNAFQNYIAFPELTGNPVHTFRHMEPVELDCYTLDPAGKSRLKQFVEEKGIVAIVYMSAMASTLDMKFLRSLGVATINTENDSFDHSKRDSSAKKIAKFIIRRVLRRQIHDLHVANAASQGDWLTSYAQIPKNRMIVIPDGVDCTYYTPRQDESEHGYLNPDNRWVICVSQSRAEKRVDWIIRAAAHMLRQDEFADVRFVYVGDGPLLAQWRDLAKQLGLERRFHFAGAQPDLRPYYRSSSLMVHASERESFGLVLVEAMACGLPLVACAAAGPSEIVVDGKTGTLVGVDDESGFRQAVEFYLRNPTIANKHGAEGRKRAEQMFSIDRQARDIASAILAVVSL